MAVRLGLVVTGLVHLPLGRKRNGALLKRHTVITPFVLDATSTSGTYSAFIVPAPLRLYRFSLQPEMVVYGEKKNQKMTNNVTELFSSEPSGYTTNQKKKLQHIFLEICMYLNVKLTECTRLL